MGRVSVPDPTQLLTWPRPFHSDREGDAMEPAHEITLLIDPAVSKTLEERGIREDDLRQLLQAVQNGRGYHVNPATGHLLAYHTPGKVTFWVEYRREEGGYRI